MKRTTVTAALVGIVVGVLIAFTIATVAQRRDDRAETFGLLARDLHVASNVATAAPGGSLAASRAVADDLRVVFLRYRSFESDELRILRLVNTRVQAGTVVLPAALATRLAATVPAG